jgi:hypothetical protein
MRKQHGGCIAAALAFVVLMAGCGDNAGNPTSYFPEGQTDGQATLFAVFQPAAPGDSSRVILFANVLALPPTDRVRIYLNPGGPGPDGQGFREATDGLISPIVSTGLGYSTYFTPIADYDPAIGGEIVARGSRNGYETSYAPISNVAVIPSSDALSLVRLQPITIVQPEDSTDVLTVNPVLSWQPVPGAAKYLVQVSQPTGQVIYSLLTSDTSARVGLAPGTVFESQPLRDGGFYIWTVAAVDGGYRVFASTGGVSAFVVHLPELP